MASPQRRAFGLTVVFLAFAIGGCRDARSHLDAGVAYDEANKPREAVLEYRNAVEKDPDLGNARVRLGDALLKTGDAVGGLRELIRGADLKAGDVDLQVRVGQLLLRGRQFDQARVRADKALAKAPTRTDAIVLRANALAGLTNVDQAVTELKDALAIDPKAALFTTLGVVQSGRGNAPEAQAAFENAVRLDPKSIDARLGQANFFWSKGRTADAEAALQAARGIDPRHVVANRALALLYLSTNRGKEAGPLLKSIAEQTGRAADRLDLADYYVAMEQPVEAVTQLDAIATDQRAWSAARGRRALIEEIQGRPEVALATIGEVLAKEPRNPDALVIKARLELAAHKPDLAEPPLRSALEIDARHLGARYLLGTVLAASGRLDEAAAAFAEVLKLNPRAAAAQMGLARIDLLRGQPVASLERAGQALKAAPGHPSARLLLVRGYLGKRDLAAADRELAALVTAFPKAAPVQVELGRLRLAQGRTAAARTAFEKAAAEDASSIDALAGLVGVDVREGKLDAAENRVAARLKAAPRQAGLLVLSARIAMARPDLAAGEARLRQAIEADSGNFAAYNMLGQLYFSLGKLDQARAEFDAIAARQPRPIGALTMAGIILQAEGKGAEARARYEKALQIDRRAPVAANNLAWLYAEEGANLGQALELAQIAKAGLPQLPEVNDTLGFIYLKRDVPSLAIPPLREAVTAEPGNPVYRYRLGQALARAGQRVEAKRELEDVLTRTPTFRDAEDVKRLLKTLG